MDISLAQTICHSMMKEHNLLNAGWSFKFDNAVKRMGLCNHTRKTLSLSRFFVSAATEHQMRQIMLHEIAHALLPHSAGHSFLWKAKAASIGYMGERTMPNPYTEQQFAKARLSQTPSRQATGIAQAGVTQVGIGSKISYKDEIYTIVKRGRSRWQAVIPGTSHRLFVPFSIAHLHLTP